jgi:hypothetical protein
VETLGRVDETASLGDGEKGFGQTYIHDFSEPGDPSGFSILNTEKICLPHASGLLRLH